MFQWPEPASCKFHKANPVNYKYKKNKINPNESQIKKIENFFSDEYKAKYAILFPSGRSAINTILRYHKFDRSKIVNVPMWTSACLLHALSAMTNVTVKNSKADSIIAVHKWGNTYSFKKNINKKKQIVIDDSADSMAGKEYKPFENNSNYEILSLPKIIGSFCGGVILTNNIKFYKYSKKQQLKNKNLGTVQSKRKYKSSFIDKNNFDWRFYESHNTFVDYNSVQNVFNCLPNYKLNRNIIMKRQKLVKSYFKNIIFDKKRIGPCIIFEYKKYKKFKSILELKNYDFTKKILKEKYSKCFIFPIHFGISEKNFNKVFKKLKNLTGYKFKN